MAKESSLDKLSKEKLVGYFLMLWGVSFFLSGLSGFAYYSQSVIGEANIFVGILSSLLSIGMGIILVVLGYKIINEGLRKG